MIVASYMLNELKEDKKIEILEKLWNNTNEILFIIEPGTPENYKNILKYKLQTLPLKLKFTKL
jgi:ribosomal protein RSM22 (predicted rRNA methylase)